MKVGVIGLGAMGFGAAVNLLKAGHDVVGVEPREAGREAFAKEGGKAVASVSDLPGDREAVIVFVVNAAQAEAVLFGEGGIAPRLAKGAVVLLCSTVAPGAAVAIAKRLGGHGVLMLDSPVSGGVKGATEGSMTVMASGPDAAFAAARPVLDAIARRVWELGAEPGAGSTVKMVNQLLAGVHLAAMGEAFALGVRAGADPQVLYDVISESAGSSWMMKDRGPRLLAGDDAPRSAINIFVKDLGIVLDQARALTFPLPLSAAAHQVFLGVAAGGGGDKDDAFAIRFWQKLAGIPVPGDKKD
ncbi:L-threonate dehydrogenase [Elioraea rosea]|uniref:L-threonate dehydrogenase n=1 Tax=Elioraea rosea TaxID=2492390 RepID=UPI0011823B54|nr:L-threonate dehydrogenase [Elioraea rosea]